MRVLFIVLAIHAISGVISASRCGVDVLLATVRPGGGNSDFSTINRTDEETDVFLDAKAAVFKRDWSRARDRLKAYLERYPEGQYRDEGLFWLAKSLAAMAKRESTQKKVMVLIEESVARLGELITNYPQSLWMDDAMELKIELSSELALMGDAPSKAFIEEIIRDKVDIASKIQEDLVDQVNDDIEYMFKIQMLGLNALMDLQPEAALPVLEKIAKTEADPMIRRKAVFILGSHFEEEAVDILETVEQNDIDADVKKEARYWLREIAEARIPVELDMYNFTAKVRNPDQFDNLKEKDVLKIHIPSIRRMNSKQLVRYIRRYFYEHIGRIDNLKLSASLLGYRNHLPRIDLSIPLNITLQLMPGIVFESKKLDLGEYIMADRYVDIAESEYVINGYSFTNFEKDYDKIKGEFSFTDPKTDAEFHESFWVDSDFDQMFAVRKGNRINIALLHFESKEDKVMLSGEPKYNIHFSDVLGCRVYSVRKSWGFAEFGMENNITDFSLAKAEIIGKDGRWILVGHLLADRKNNRFVGRDAKLYDPHGKIMVKAARIIVPADKPEAYEIVHGQER